MVVRQRSEPATDLEHVAARRCAVLRFMMACSDLDVMDESSVGRKPLTLSSATAIALRSYLARTSSKRKFASD